MNDIVTLIGKRSRFAAFWGLCDRITVVVDLSSLNKALDLIIEELDRRLGKWDNFRVSGEQ